jgi:hypothetical protein
MTEDEAKGLYQSLLLAAGLAVGLLWFVNTFAPEKRAHMAATPVPDAIQWDDGRSNEDDDQTADAQATKAGAGEEDTDEQGKPRPRTSPDLRHETNRNKRAQAMFKFGK